MNIKFIYFDLDDTLLDHTKAQSKTLKEVYNTFQFETYTTLADFKHYYHHINKKLWIQYGQHEISKEQLKRNRFEQTLKKCGISADWEEVSTYYMQQYEHNWQWIPGAQDLVTYLTQKRPTGFLTNGFRDVQKKKFSTFKLSTYSDVFIISEEIGIMKPQPGIFEHATQMAGYNTDEILYVGDSLISDVNGGSQYGWNVVWHNYGKSSKTSDEAVFTYSDKKDLKKWLDNHL